MRFGGANDHPNPDSPEYYAPRSERMADPRSNATPQTSSGHLPPDPPLSRFDEMREEAFAKFTRPLESQFVYERRPARGLLATAGAIAVAIGATAILALVLFNVFPRSKSDPSELAVSISTPASATPAQATSEDSQALLEGFKQFQKIQGSEDPPVSEPALAGTAKEAPEKPQALLDKFIQWQHRK
ncbi:hypothetical protein [Bradyrhizobium sp. AUGA SZCCT0283]|jgi:hypothetical protein|uniref:hypothetical protein n=1 Tax=Bradyrhizobium sp. AUGA SZCCT0283 TaxID=2807671 RepID=UPI001BA6BFF4|nr:hypothetical protein [Bradyrhizobium sp. AUGA SZCCT0283]MBR1276931.1 hypothetical protein [Bradyrhizobium sp. AUGA SZCCT0283]